MSVMDRYSLISSEDRPELQIVLGVAYIQLVKTMTLVIFCTLKFIIMTETVTPSRLGVL